MQITHYFAYGSNMNPSRVAERGLATRRLSGGCVENFSLVFNKASKNHAGFGHANIEYDAGAVVEGVVYELCDGREILKMDPYERAPWNYGRDVIQVATGEGPLWAWTYFANPGVKQAGLRPPVDYLEHLLAGEPWLSPGYYQALLQWRQ